jgi:hypothetical protein
MSFQKLKYRKKPHIILEGGMNLTIQIHGGINVSCQILLLMYHRRFRRLFSEMGVLDAQTLSLVHKMSSRQLKNS